MLVTVEQLRHLCLIEHMYTGHLLTYRSDTIIPCLVHFRFSVTSSFALIGSEVSSASSPIDQLDKQSKAMACRMTLEDSIMSASTVGDKGSVRYGSGVSMADVVCYVPFAVHVFDLIPRRP